jgi:CheY-like chemotaxis protein
MLQIEVADTGIGMSAEQMERIFKPFEQADRSISRRFGGSGLGLAICRQLVELMGGRIEVSSEPGQGSLFSLELSVSPYEAPSTVEQAVRLAPTHRRSLVLVVDDDRDARDLLQGALTRHGLNVITASSGIDALQRVRSERPAVMLLDILLGDMSGWDVLTILRADPMHADLPVILCTVTDPDHRTASLGVIEHLTKPIDRDHLATLVRRFVGTDETATVMVVDDDDDYREQLAMVLRRGGHRVRMAPNGHQALQQMRQETPDLVLLDLVMPGMDGLGVIDQMQQDPALACIQVVLVTAADVGADILRQLNERAVTLMHKDQVDLEQIARKATELVDRVERSADPTPENDG